ncbi:hypothetical protein [Flavobacterium gilvum]|uniref:Uncharacterized protein n=1 Tax=Flavobacterium gilvum TaxID=1492737 RepID=A0AAC9I2S1_9FLAO|nr:hypothetical protein [Flavobacterium gilvum]AOW08347.1 hypothetical protein EM308_01850 [Flavobacterium gilvum]KFC58275.1 hypothetical protein FEM08_29540 [Flavobacterium gilvum]
MKTITYITSRVELLKKSILKLIKIETFNPIKELNHPRFHIDKNFDLKGKKGKGSLLFHMYSKENDTLFI